MLTNLLTNLWADLQDIHIAWQFAVIVLCFLLSYLISQDLRQRFPVEVDSSSSEILATQSFGKMLFPTLLWAFVYIGKLILSHWQHTSLLSLFIPILGSMAIISFARYLSRRIFAHSYEISSAYLFLIEKVFFWGAWIVLVLYYTGILQSIMRFMDEHMIPIGRDKFSLTEILQVLVAVAVTVLLALWISAALEKRLMKMPIHSSLRLVLVRLGRSLLLLCAILVSLNLVGIDLTVLSVFGGALGVGLGFGMQKIASNYVSGVIILLDRSLSINDLISVDKYNGKVSEINARYTVLKGLDGVESIIPNEMLVSSPVQNLSLTDTAVWLSTDLVVAYNTDIEALLPMLVEAACSVERVLQKSMPSANLMNFGINGLELRVGFWINDPENGRMGVLSQVNRAIWKLLQEQKITIPYQQGEIRVKSA